MQTYDVILKERTFEIVLIRYKYGHFFFKGLGNVAEKLLSKCPQEIAIHSIIIYELEVGIAKSNNTQKRKQQLNSLLSYIDVFFFTSKEAEFLTSIQ